VLQDADRAAIRALEADWIVAELGSDRAALERLLTHDCALCPPDGPKAEGRQAFLDAQAAPEKILDIAIADSHIDGGPSHAWKTARFQTRLSMQGGELTVSGRHMWLMRKQDGAWRIAALSWSFDHR